MIIDNSPLVSYKLQKSEVQAICESPLADLLKVHVQKSYKFTTEILDNTGHKSKITVNRDSFPIGWDNYHYKIALLTERFLKGEKNLIY